MQSHLLPQGLKLYALVLVLSFSLNSVFHLFVYLFSGNSRDIRLQIGKKKKKKAFEALT